MNFESSLSYGKKNTQHEPKWFMEIRISHSKSEKIDTGIGFSGICVYSTAFYIYLLIKLDNKFVT